MKKPLRKILRLGAIIAALLILAVAAAVLLVLFDKPLSKHPADSAREKGGGDCPRRQARLFALPFTHHRRGARAWALENDFQKWDLSIARLEAKGDFRKLVRGKKPALETVEPRAPSSAWNKRLSRGAAGFKSRCAPGS